MRPLVFALLCVFLTSCATQSERPADQQRLSQLQNALTTKHPAAYFEVAEKLWESGERDRAVVMFYVGQIRYRAYLNTLPADEALAEERTYEKLQAELGEPLNQYAAGDVDNWVQLIDRALEWHKTNPNEFLPKDEYHLLYEMILYDFRQLRQYIVNNKALIRAQREAQGLENR